MKRVKLIIAGLVIFALVFAGSWAAAADRMGFVNMREILGTSTAGKKADEEIKKLIEKSKIPIQDRETELRKLKDELEKQRPLLKAEALKDKETVYQKKLRDYQILVEDSNKEIQMKQQDLSSKLIPEILKTIETIGEKEKFSMIIDVETPTLAYHAKENDITKRVIEEFNKSYKPNAGGKK